MKLFAKYLIATLLALFLVGLLAAFGNRQLSQLPSSVSNFSAYPLPGTPIPGSSGPVATPTRLAAYPLPGAKPPAPKPGAPSAPLTFTAVSTTYLPLISKDVGPKGTAGINSYFPDLASRLGYSNELVMGVNWGYQWNRVFTTTYHPFAGDTTTTEYDLGYQVVNDVRSKPGWVWDINVELCPGNSNDPYTHDPSIIMSPTVQAARQMCVADIARARPGLYWMIWNEPDLDANESDTISPTLAAQYFKVISDTILTADPKAKLIVGNVSSVYPNPPDTSCGRIGAGTGCGVNWITQFISSYITMTNGVDPRLAIAGYGIHAYSDAEMGGLGLIPCTNIYDSGANPCLLSHFKAMVTAGTAWVTRTDPGKEVWVTELNWESGDKVGDTWNLQTARMTDICTELASDIANGSIQRYSWFYGLYPYTTSDTAIITASLYSADISGNTVIYTGTLSPAGQQFISCPP